MKQVHDEERVPFATDSLNFHHHLFGGQLLEKVTRIVNNNS